MAEPSCSTTQQPGRLRPGPAPSTKTRPRRLDRSRARDQWGQLRALVECYIAPVELLQPEPWAPAMVFTRDLAVACDDDLIPLLPASHRGPFEAPLFDRAMSRLGASRHRHHDSPRVCLDGGNVLADSERRLLIGILPQQTELTRRPARALAAKTGRRAIGVPLASPRFPHIDMVLADLAGKGWLVHAEALRGFDLNDSAWLQLFGGRPVIVVDPADGDRLACNVIVHRDVALGPEISGRLRRRIERLGIQYVPTPLDELHKAGGSAHCLTLELPPKSLTPR